MSEHIKKQRKAAGHQDKSRQNKPPVFQNPQSENDFLVSDTRLDPSLLSPKNALFLQRTIGNRAVVRMVSQEQTQNDTITPTTRIQTGERIQRNVTQRIRQNEWRNAKAQHRRDRDYLIRVVRAGRQQTADLRLKNACEWVQKRKTRLYAVTPTGDRVARLQHHGLNPATDEAWFPKGDGGPGDIFSAPVDYNWASLGADPNVDLDDDDGRTTEGWNGAGYLAICNPLTRTQANIWETVKHEVQHDADKNREKEAAVAGTEWKVNLEGYKTEYRAYSYEGSSYDNLDHALNNNGKPTTPVTKYGYQWTARQLAIFEDIFEGYDHTSDGWGSRNDDPISKPHLWPGPGFWRRLRQRKFQAAVVAYRNPDVEGFNKYDSVRVEDFYVALDAVPANTSAVNQADVRNLIRVGFTAGTKLTREDAQYILNESPDFTKKLNKHLAGAARTRIINLLGAVV